MNDMIGVDINTTDENGMTPLHWAVQAGHVDCLRALLDCEAVKVNARDSVGWTPLHYAGIYIYLLIHLPLSISISLSIHLSTYPSFILTDSSYQTILLDTSILYIFISIL